MMLKEQHSRIDEKQPIPSAIFPLESLSGMKSSTQVSKNFIASNLGPTGLACNIKNKVDPSVLKENSALEISRVKNFMIVLIKQQPRLYGQGIIAGSILRSETLGVISNSLPSVDRLIFSWAVHLLSLFCSIKNNYSVQMKIKFLYKKSY